MSEIIGHRVLAAMRFLDAGTQLHIQRPLALAAPNARIVRNHRGLYILLANANGVDPAGVEITVADAGYQYLPRRLTLNLPLDPDPENAGQEDSLFRPQDLLLFRSLAAHVDATWAVVHATVRDQAGEPVPAALLTVSRTVNGASTTLARALTEWRGRTVGEALIGVPGIPSRIPGTSNGNGNNNDNDGAVTVREVPARIDVVADPDFSIADGQPPDPDLILDNLGSLPSTGMDIQLVRGQTLAVTLALTLT